LPDLDACALQSNGGQLPYLIIRGLKSEGCSCHLLAEALIPTRPGLPGQVEMKGGAPETSEPTSDYALGTVAYGHPGAILVSNMRAVSGDKLYAASLCASAEYSEGLDIFAIEPSLAPNDVADTAEWCFRQSGQVHIKTLKALLGKDAAGSLVLDHIISGAPPPRDALINQCARRVAQLKHRATIPFAFMRVEENTALTGPFPRELVTKEVWYGQACR
jgi:hypothetical protein